MDYMEKINELRAKKSQILSDAEAQIAAGNFEDAGKASEEMEKKYVEAIGQLKEVMMSEKLRKR